MYFLGYCNILPVFMDFHTQINPLISLKLFTVLHYSDICHFYSHDKLSVGFSSALKRNC